MKHTPFRLLYCTVLTLVLAFSCIFTIAPAQEFLAYEQAVPGSSVKFKMIPIQGGSFTLGSAAAETGREEDEGPQKKVEVSAFWMEEHEVTFAEWDAFFKNMDVPQTKAIDVDAVSRPTAQYIDLTWGMGREPQHPANSMSQQACIMYCKWLYAKTGIFYRLPTEAEWEYACRAGTTTAYSFGNDARQLPEHGYFAGNSGGKYHLVKQLKPNAWGLYDMHGNLSEWTQDQYDAAAYNALADGVKDPTVAPASRYPRAARGGSYVDDASVLRTANRIPSNAAWNKRDPQIPKSRWWLTDGMYMGFRIVRPLAQPTAAEADAFYASYLK
ncbi:formylglycine-generating enzyme family protein [Dawidia soli]|nr:SUMF1/EgtB/PvdO family nonheme iron enzyme [Dawidia soli]